MSISNLTCTHFSFLPKEFNGPISAIDTFYTYANNALKDPKAVQTGCSSKANSAKPINRETKEYIDKIFDLKIPLHRRLAVFKAISIGFGLRGGEVEEQPIALVAKRARLVPRNRRAHALPAPGGAHVLPAIPATAHALPAPGGAHVLLAIPATTHALPI